MLEIGWGLCKDSRRRAFPAIGGGAPESQNSAVAQRRPNLRGRTFGLRLVGLEYRMAAPQFGYG